MAFLQWRRFNFFDKETLTSAPTTPGPHSVNEPHASGLFGPIAGLAEDGTSAETANIFERLKEIRITCTTTGRGHIVLGDSDGYIHTINRQFEYTSFKGFENCVTHIHQVVQNAFLITAGSDDPGVPVVKIWNQDKADPHQQGQAGRKPFCTRVIRAVTGVTPTPITTIAAVDSLTLLTIGFGDGNVLFIRGDITREKHSKQKMVQVSEHPVTGLSFKEIALPQPSQSQLQFLQSYNTPQKKVILFITTTKAIFSYIILSKEKETMSTIEPNFGCDPRCSCLINDPKQQENSLFVVGRKDAIYFYQSDGRGPCLAFEGEKLIMHWFRGYLVVIGKEIPAGMGGNRKLVSTQVSDGVELMGQIATPTRFGGPSPNIATGSMGPNMNIITIYDIQNKYIAYSSPVPVVVDVMSEWGSLYLLTKDGRLLYLREKDTTSKLELLFKKNQFSLAIELAKSHQYDEDGLADIFKQYGDHLYKKGDHEGAIAQYGKTIGKLEPSYVIRKFLDAQRVHNLTAYLQELHKKGLANEDHTTLLLNCYAKLKDITKLDEFIKGTNASGTNNGAPPNFDVETAIKVLRQAGFWDHALYLASNDRRHDWFFKIQLEDKGNAIGALDYMKKNLDSTDLIAQHLVKYGRFLMDKEPDMTTALVKSLCSTSAQKRPSGSRPKTGSEVNPPDILEGMGLFVGEERGDDNQPLNPDMFLNIFVKNSSKMLEFLEYIIETRPETATSPIYNTLLDLYLRSYKSEVDSNKKDEHEKKILVLLKTPEAHYDVEQAMVLCQMNGFQKGLLYLYERAGLFQLILQHHIKKDDQENVVKCCEQYGDKQASLWVDALWYFATNSGTNSRLLHVLGEIEKRKLLPPIMIINILSKNSTAPLSVVKDYLIRCLTRESEMITENERLINQYKDETEKMRDSIEEMKTNPKVFQAGKCSGCNHPLELPSVHFLCGHSYHQQCFESYSAENDSECPLCMPENRRLMNLIKSRENLKNLHETFKERLAKSENDAISVISSYFSKGVFSPQAAASASGSGSVSVSRPNTLDLQQPVFKDMF